MARYTASQLGALASKIRSRDSVVESSAANSVNKAATFSADLSTSFIVQEVNLSRGYLRGKIRTVKRAAPGDLTAIVRANTRNTLLTRYPYQRTLTGVRVNVNKSGGFKEIRSGFFVSNLRNSGATGIAVSNRDAIEIFSKGKRTPARSRKLQRRIRAARENPRGIYVLNSRSVNQLFTSVRIDVQPRVVRFMRDEFVSQLARKTL